jgi:hypothetical protein
MLIAAIILFILAAVFGLIILIAILQDRPTIKVSVLLHGSIALVAIMLVIIYMFISGSSTLLITSLSLFILAALGGIALATLDMSNKKIPKIIAVVHALIALAGLIALVIHVLP